MSTSVTLRSGLDSQWWTDERTKTTPAKPAPPPTTSRAHIRRSWLSRSRASSVRGAWWRPTRRTRRAAKAIEEKPISTLDAPRTRRVVLSMSGFFCKVSSGKSNAACRPTGPASTRTRLVIRAQSRWWRCAPSAVPERAIGAGNDSECAVKWHRKYAAQRGQRLPHIDVLDEVSEILVSRKAKARG